MHVTKNPLKECFGNLKEQKVQLIIYGEDRGLQSLITKEIKGEFSFT